MFETEVKYRCKSHQSSSRLHHRLIAEGYEFEGSVRTFDAYYDHPGLKLRERKELLRVRRFEPGGARFLTWKGASVKRSGAKSRSEIEIAAPREIEGMLEALGFASKVRVQKHQARYVRGPIKASIDDIRGVGRFVELEIVSEGPASAQVGLTLQAAAQRIGLSSAQIEARSYAELVSSVARKRPSKLSREAR